MKKLYGAIEAGGTKFVCAAGSGPEDLEETRFETGEPEATLSRAADFFKRYGKNIRAIGIGSFGPVDLDEKSETWGRIAATPKKNWSNTDFAGTFKKALGVPVAFDTDVNAAAMGEYTWGNARGLADFVYLTIGTGIGGGGMTNGRLMRGLNHPEMGHILIPRREDDSYRGKCPFHKNRCFEGLACGPAVEERWNAPAKSLGENHKAWDMEADYIAAALACYTCVLSPRRIIIGGSVMKVKGILERTREKFERKLNGYFPKIAGKTGDYIVKPGLGDRAGILGAIALAQAYENS